MNQPNEYTPSLSDERKPYASPQLIAEMELETRAGSPLGEPDLLESEDQ